MIEHDSIPESDKKTKKQFLTIHGMLVLVTLFCVGVLTLTLSSSYF